MCHIQQIVSSLIRTGNILLVLDTQIFFQMVFKTQEISISGTRKAHKTYIAIVSVFFFTYYLQH